MLLHNALRVNSCYCLILTIILSNLRKLFTQCNLHLTNHLVNFFKPLHWDLRGKKNYTTNELNLHNDLNLHLFLKLYKIILSVEYFQFVLKKIWKRWKLRPGIMIDKNQKVLLYIFLFGCVSISNSSHHLHSNQKRDAEENEHHVLNILRDHEIIPDIVDDASHADILKVSLFQKIGYIYIIFSDFIRFSMREIWMLILVTN